MVMSISVTITEWNSIWYDWELCFQFPLSGILKSLKLSMKAVKFSGSYHNAQPDRSHLHSPWDRSNMNIYWNSWPESVFAKYQRHKWARPAPVSTTGSGPSCPKCTQKSSMKRLRGIHDKHTDEPREVLAWHSPNPSETSLNCQEFWKRIAYCCFIPSQPWHLSQGSFRRGLGVCGGWGSCE